MLRRIHVAFALPGLAMLSAGCGLIEPCGLTKSTNKSYQIDGTWTIQTVNGTPIPAAGFVIPSSTDRLRSGTLNFKTTSSSGDCATDADEGTKPDEGRVLAVYEIANSAGQEKPYKVYAGSFTFQPRTDEVTLKADERSTSGVRVFEDMTFSGTIPLFGSGIVKFKRTSRSTSVPVLDNRITRFVKTSN